MIKIQITNKNSLKFTFLKVLCHFPKKSQIQKELCSSFPCMKKILKIVHIYPKITLYTLVHQLMPNWMVLLRSLGSCFQFKISFENQTCLRDFPWSKIGFYFLLRTKSYKWLDSITAFHREENRLGKKGFAEDPSEWESQDLWSWLLAPGPHHAPWGPLCVFLDRRHGANEGWQKSAVRSELTARTLSASPDICKMNGWMKCTNSLIHSTNMNYMFTLYQLQCPLQWL